MYRISHMCALHIIVPYFFGLVCLYFCMCELFPIFSCLYFALCLNAQMSASFPIYFGFVYGASQHNQNLALAAWIIYHSGELVSSGGICLGSTTNNVVEYHVIIELLTKASSLGISQLIINLDSQLVFRQLNRVYNVRNTVLLHLYLIVFRLERYIDFIEYRHISRQLNTIMDSLANYMLDWHISHR
jgi:ribonuclease HI